MVGTGWEVAVGEDLEVGIANPVLGGGGDGFPEEALGERGENGAGKDDEAENDEAGDGDVVAAQASPCIAGERGRGHRFGERVEIFSREKLRAEAGVENERGDVGEPVGDDDERAVEEDEGEDHGGVTRGDGFDEMAADAWDLENGFDNHRA